MKNLEMITKLDTTWTLQQALEYIREQQPIFRSFNFHLALAGSVLNKGLSENDLDIIIMGMHNDKELNWDGLMNHLINGINAFSISSDDYKFDGRRLYRSMLGDKQIDWFLYDWVEEDEELGTES